MHRMRRLALVFWTLVGCASSTPRPTLPAAQARRSLYDRLGGLPAITAAVDSLVKNLAADERINARFAGADLPDLRQKLIDQICQATGGPCVYKGRDMLIAHRGMNVQPSEFDALVEDLRAALGSVGVPAPEQSDLLGALGGMRSQIVDNGSALATP